MLRPDNLVFVADENFDFGIVKILREKGYSVLAIAESFSSIPDPQVLQLTNDRNAILLTEDKDFGELVHSSASYATFRYLVSSTAKNKQFRKITTSLRCY